ncbi:MAG: cytochrome c [Armatimonadetes bacterium]|nr:cytochrome c [Armatimonadota bacterium]
MNARLVYLTILAGLTATIFGQTPTRDVFGGSSCMGCHGQSAMGGLGPPLAKTKLSIEEFQKIVRSGKGMMPAIKENDLSPGDLQEVYTEVSNKPWLEDQIPIAYKVGRFLSPTSVSHIFMVAFLFCGIFAVRGITYWLRCAGFKQLLPSLAKLGWAKAIGIALKSLIVDGFLVGSLWKNNKKRWVMHGLLIYGFCGLLLADILIAIFNPQRGQLPLTDPLKLLPIVSGFAVALGVCYVMYRYKKDEYIDNGLTLGKDFLFVNLLFHVAISGFLVVTLKRLGINDWVMTIYLYHLASVFLLIVTGPFTRFQHMYVVPIMVAVTRLTEAVTATGVELGFQREPSPGRHHKSARIAEDVLKQVGLEGKVVMRYYP